MRKSFAALLPLALFLLPSCGDGDEEKGCVIQDYAWTCSEDSAKIKVCATKSITAYWEASISRAMTRLTDKKAYGEEKEFDCLCKNDPHYGAQCEAGTTKPDISKPGESCIPLKSLSYCHPQREGVILMCSPPEAQTVKDWYIMLHNYHGAGVMKPFECKCVQPEGLPAFCSDFLVKIK